MNKSSVADIFQLNGKYNVSASLENITASLKPERTGLEAGGGQGLKRRLKLQTRSKESNYSLEEM